MSCTTAFEQKYPLAYVIAKTRASSDHIPLVLNLGLTETKKPGIFRFEKWWLKQPDFKDLVIKAWNTPHAYIEPTDIWQFKIRILRKKVKGWSINTNAYFRKQKQDLLKEFDLLDLQLEEGSLDLIGKNRLKEITRDLVAIWRMEEMKARQKSRDRNIKEGDKNTTYFQAVANQRNRKKRIVGLEGPDGWIEGNDNLLSHAVDFYKNLFGQEEDSGISLGENFWEESEKVSNEERDFLEADFTELEVKEAIFSSYAEGPPGPDSFSFLFYQTFWDTIKKDFMQLVNSFSSGSLNLDILNYAMISLIPKEPKAKTLKKFSPISLINCSFKVFAKLLNNRLVRVADRLIAPNQTTFLKGRYILESVVAAHEIIYDIHRNKESGIILKLDYERAYDRVSWRFLEEMLQSRGFGEKWISWILKIVKGGSISVRMNDENSCYFRPGKGLRQGGPLSPLLFNLVADVF